MKFIADTKLAPIRLTIGIPSYNRSECLYRLLHSISLQSVRGFDVCVVDNASPDEGAYRKVVQEFHAEHADIPLHYYRNSKNLGFDGNCRQVISHARGEFIFFMGDDDLMKPTAIELVADALVRNPDIGVLFGSRENHEGSIDKVIATFRYFPTDRFFPAGVDATQIFFRRSYSLTGYTVHRESALKVATDKFDGTLLYQFHLSSRILQFRNGFYLAEVLTSMRRGALQETSNFGDAEAEIQFRNARAGSTEYTLRLISGMLLIAADAEKETGCPLVDVVKEDIGNYSYSYLRVGDRRKMTTIFREFLRMGLVRTIYPWLYYVALFLLGTRGCDATIAFIKRRIGRTPLLGKVGTGAPSNPKRKTS